MAESKKPVRLPIKVIEGKKLTIEDVTFTLEATIYEPFKDKEGAKPKLHKRVGYATLFVGNATKLNGINIFLDVVNNTYWLAFPNMFTKGKRIDYLYFPKEIKMQFNELLNGNEIVPEEIFEEEGEL